MNVDPVLAQIGRGAGHELGNILQIVLGKAVLAVETEDLARIRENIEGIIRAADRATVIVRNLQVLGQTSDAMSPTDVSAAMGEAFEDLSAELRARKISLRDQREETGKVTANAVSLRLLFLNLLTNAVDVTPQRGIIEAGCGRRDGRVEAWVRDAGEGIPPEVLPKIFDLGFTTKGNRGAGLGLWVCREIIQGQGGTISVSSAPGKGTTFSVLLGSR